jgi:hypothetical protein
MIHDALRRRVGTGWYVALLFPVPLSEFVYFFTIKLRDFGLQAIAADAPQLERAPEQLARLEREVQQSPSFHNRVRLGWALHERELHERAETQFERALSTHPRDKEALLGLGVSRLARGAYDDAATALEPIVERNLAYEHYGAALALAEALFRGGHPERGRAWLESVIADSGDIGHSLMLARHELRVHERARAKRVLRRALDAFATQPDVERRRDGALATEARRLLRTLEEQTS